MSTQRMVKVSILWWNKVSESEDGVKPLISLFRYGPFWICSTLVFVTAALGNFAAYLAHKTSAGGGEAWHYDINKVTYAAIMFYGYVGVIPLGLYFLLKYLGVVSGLIQLWCLYGYSLFVFIPASVTPLLINHSLVVLLVSMRKSCCILSTRSDHQLMFMI